MIRGTAMIQRLSAWLYRAYLRFLWLGAAHQHPASAPPLDEAALQSQGRTFADLDAEATRRGETYRGLGVLIGILGALIIFLALAPKALPADGPWVDYAKFTKIALMIAVFGLVALAWRLKLKERWIAARRQAEYLRYSPLAAAIADADAQVPGAAIKLREELLRVLGDETQGQIHYNETKRAAYAGIELFTKWLTYAGFVVSFVFAAAAVVADQPWFLFFTVFLPGLIGTMHGLNAFLRLHQLEAQHADMAAALRSLKSELADADSPDSNARLIDCARRALKALREGDSAWAGIAKEQDVGPP